MVSYPSFEPESLRKAVSQRSDNAIAKLEYSIREARLTSDDHQQLSAFVQSESLPTIEPTGLQMYDGSYETDFAHETVLNKLQHFVRMHLPLDVPTRNILQSLMSFPVRLDEVFHHHHFVIFINRNDLYCEITWPQDEDLDLKAALSKVKQVFFGFIDFWNLLAEGSNKLVAKAIQEFFESYVAKKQALSSRLDELSVELGVPTPRTLTKSRGDFLGSATLAAEGTGLGRTESTVESDQPPAHTNTSDSTPGLQSRFEKIAELGRGGFGVVYKAYDRQLDKVFALKELDPHPFNVGDAASVLRAKERFVRESKLLLELSHESIVRIYSVDLEHQTPYILTEYIEWPTLTSSLQACGPLGSLTAAILVEKLVLALDYAFSRHGVIHRDLKPSNILACLDSKQLKVIDFGMAGVAESFSTLQTSITLTSEKIGGNYSSPKYLNQPKAKFPAVDIYSVGLVWSEMLLGSQSSPNNIEKLLSQNGVDTRTVETIMWCLSEEDSLSYTELTDKIGGIVRDLCKISGNGSPVTAPAPTRDRLPPPIDEMFARGLRHLAKQDAELAKEYGIAICIWPTCDLKLALEELDTVAEFAAKHPNTGWPIGLSLPRLSLPYPVRDGLEFQLLERDLNGNLRFDYWSLDCSGTFFMLRVGDQIDKSGPVLDHIFTTVVLLEFFEYALRLSRKIAEKTGRIPLTFEVNLTLKPTNNLLLGTLDRSYLPRQSAQCKVDEISCSRRLEFPARAEMADPIVLSMLNEVFRYFRFSTSPAALQHCRTSYLTCL